MAVDLYSPQIMRRALLCAFSKLAMRGLGPVGSGESQAMWPNVIPGRTTAAKMWRACTRAPPHVLWERRLTAMVWARILSRTFCLWAFHVSLASKMTPRIRAWGDGWSVIWSTAIGAWATLRLLVKWTSSYFSGARIAPFASA